jgi:hypothetical protein
LTFLSLTAAKILEILIGPIFVEIVFVIGCRNELFGDMECGDISMGSGLLPKGLCDVLGEPRPEKFNTVIST